MPSNGVLHETTHVSTTCHNSSGLDVMRFSQYQASSVVSGVTGNVGTTCTCILQTLGTVAPGFVAMKSLKALAPCVSVNAASYSSGPKAVVRIIVSSEVVTDHMQSEEGPPCTGTKMASNKINTKKIYQKTGCGVSFPPPKSSLPLSPSVTSRAADT